MFGIGSTKFMKKMIWNYRFFFFADRCSKLRKEDEKEKKEKNDNDNDDDDDDDDDDN